MPTYRYVATNLLTGQLLADDLPVVVISASRHINAVGQISGYLPLQQNGGAGPFVSALTPRKSVLWILQDEFPVGGWIIWDTPHRSILDNQLPFQGKTLESLFTFRHITSALAYTNTDVFDIARALVAYGVNAAVQGQNAGVAGLVMQAGESGVLDTLSLGVSNTLQAPPNVYTGVYATNQPVLDALITLAAADAFEFTFEPAVSGTGFGWLLRLGYPALGQWNTPSPFALTFPGNALDYARPVMGSGAGNILIVTSASNGTGLTFLAAAPHGVDTADLNAGYPAQQQVVSWPGVGVTSQAQINAYADEQLGLYTAGTMVPTVTVGGGTEPLLRELGLGDLVNFAATSALDPAVNGQPGLQLQARIAGWTLTPPAEKQSEQVVLALGALVGQVSTGGVS
jgi:hypothetical protein